MHVQNANMRFTCSEPEYFHKIRLVRPVLPSGTYLSSLAALNNPHWNVCKLLLITHQTWDFFYFFVQKFQQMSFFFLLWAGLRHSDLLCPKRDILSTVPLRNKRINVKGMGLDGVCVQTRRVKISSPGRLMGILIIFLVFSLTVLFLTSLATLWLCCHREEISCMTKQPARASLTFTTKFLCLHGLGSNIATVSKGSEALTPIRAWRRSVLAAGICGHASHGVSSPTLLWIPNILWSQPDRRSGTNCSGAWSFSAEAKIAPWRNSTTHVSNTGTSTLCFQNCVVFFFVVLFKCSCLHLSCVYTTCYGYPGLGKHWGQSGSACCLDLSYSSHTFLKLQ